MRPCWAGLALAAGLLLAVLAAPPSARAEIGLCSAEGRALMRSVEIPPAKIAELCAKAARSSAPLTVGITRTQDELGYCRVTLSLTNNTTLHLNSLALTVKEARFHPFVFRNIPPGGTGHASANSRILLACDELPVLKLVFHWPASLRIGDRSPTGQQLAHYRPQLLDEALAWSR